MLFMSDKYSAFIKNSLKTILKILFCLQLDILTETIFFKRIITLHYVNIINNNLLKLFTQIKCYHDIKYCAIILSVINIS